MFGFHLAALDIRQHSRVHAAVIAELLRLAGVSEDYQRLPEPEKIALLENELANPRPLYRNREDFSDQTVELLDVFNLMNQVMQHNQKAIQQSIVLRNPYTDVLNLIQVELLKRWSARTEKQSLPLRQALFLSINGIAAAMQSTG